MRFEIAILLIVIGGCDAIKCISSSGSSSFSTEPENRTIVECEAGCSTSTMIVEDYEMDDGSVQTIFVGISRSCAGYNQYIGPNGGCMRVQKYGRYDLLCECIMDYCNF